MPEKGQYFDVFHDPTTEDLAAASAKFEALPDETPSRKARVRAAVATFGRLLNKPAEAIPAQAMFLKQRFMQLKHRPTGLSAKSVANCKSELRHLIARVGSPGGRSQFRPLTPEWVALRNAVPEEPWIWKLSRLMAFASGLEIAPSEIDEAFIERFREAIRATDEVDQPDRFVRLAVRTWNDLAAAMPDRSLSPLPLAERRVPRWTIEPTEFPESYRQDVEAWLACLSTVDPEGEEGPIRALRPESLRLRRHQAFKAASALVFAGTPVETVTSLASLVDIEAFKTILKHLRERQGGEPTTALYSVATCLKFIAKHHVRVEEATLSRMNRICANYKVQQGDRQSKNHTRLMGFEDEKLLGALMHLPRVLLDEAARPSTSHTQARRLAQIAVAIEIEVHAPLRLANLVALNIPGNVQAVSVQGKIRWIIRFDRHETKNRTILAYELGSESVGLIERALKLYDQTGGWLFPGTKGTHKGSGLFGRQISLEISERLGLPFNTHMFRGLVASLQTRENANGFEIGRAMLGDRSDRVVRAHYTTTAERRLIEQGQETVRRVRIRTAPFVAKA